MNLFVSISFLNSTVSVKILSSGQNSILVPLFLPFLMATSGSCGMPSLKNCSYTLPSLVTVRVRSLESAFTTDTPTPCRPPETLYVSLSNFPPACSTVSTTVAAEIFSVGCSATGIPLPLSSTIADPSLVRVTLIVSQYPAIASSMELSTTSYTR